MFKELFRKIYYFNIYRKLKFRGNNIRLSKGGVISRPNELSIGSNVFIGKGFVISARNMKIGNNIMIGPYLLAECDDHVFDKIGKTMFETRNERNEAGITIENDVWIGGHVTLLKGIKVSEGSIIGAGSVVTKSTLPYTINFGNPCLPYKPRFSIKDLEKHLELVGSNYNFDTIIDLWKKNNLI